MVNDLRGRVAVWLWGWQARWMEEQLGLCVPAKAHEDLTEPEKEILRGDAAELLEIIEEVMGGVE